MIFAVVDFDDCEKCNQVANKAFQNEVLGLYINEKLIPIRITKNHPERNAFLEEFSSNYKSGIYFINSDMELVHVYPGSTDYYDFYVKQINIAISKNTEGKIELKKLDLELINNPGNINALMRNLSKRFELGKNIDSLLDLFIDKVPADSLQSLTFLQYLSKLSPLVDSKALLKLRENNDLFNQAWYRIPLNERIKINKTCIYSSMTKAIKEKNMAYAGKVASFSANTYHPDKKEAEKAYYYQWLRYYFDTENFQLYIKNAIPHFSKHYLSVSKAEIQTKDSLAKTKFLQSISTSIDENFLTNSGVRKEIAYTPHSQFFSIELNNAAFKIYKHTVDTVYLKNALSFVKYGIEFFQSPEIFDTYARILYKLGMKEEAIKQQEKAVELSKKSFWEDPLYASILNKMKSGVADLEE